MSQVEENKATVLRYLAAIPVGDTRTIGACVTEDVVVHPPLPSALNHDGTDQAAGDHGREAVMQMLGTAPFEIYVRGSIEIEIQNILGEGDLVAVQYKLRSTIRRTGEPYENWYYQLHRFDGPLIAEYWTYLDTAYSRRVIFGL